MPPRRAEAYPVYGRPHALSAALDMTMKAHVARTLAGKSAPEAVAAEPHTRAVEHSKLAKIHLDAQKKVYSKPYKLSARNFKRRRVFTPYKTPFAR